MKKFNMLMLSSLLVSASFAQAQQVSEETSADLSIAEQTPKLTINTANSTVNLAYAPVYSITDRVGTFMREVQGMGVNFLSYQDLADKQFLADSRDSVVYAEIGQMLEELGEPLAIEKINNALEAGHTVVLETEYYDISALNELVQILSPDLAEFKTADVMVSLKKNALGNVRTVPVKITELMVDLGVPYKETHEYQLKRLQAEKDLLKPEAAQPGIESTLISPVPDLLEAFHLITEYTYDDNPPTQFYSDGNYQVVTPTGFGNFRLAHNFTQVDLWTYHYTGYEYLDPMYCVIAWRGTNTGDSRDVYEDISSQVRSTIQLNGTPNGAKGAQGFVRRINDLSEYVEEFLRDMKCDNVHIVGHSLGAALAQLHAYKITHQDEFRVFRLHVFNSPNFANEQMRNHFRALDAQDPALKMEIFNRYNDAVVNSVPTGLRRFGHTPMGITTVRDVTYVGSSVTINSFGNHGLNLWLTSP